jgi:uncharacterized protein YfiM (DUF2279 family)
MKRLILALALVVSGCAQDKVGHFVGGAITSAFVTEVTGSPLAGCAAALGIGVAKEAYDSKYGGTVETMDALATVTGCVLTWKF